MLLEEQWLNIVKRCLFPHPVNESVYFKRTLFFPPSFFIQGIIYAGHY